MLLPGFGLPATPSAAAARSPSSPIAARLVGETCETTRGRVPGGIRKGLRPRRCRTRAIRGEPIAGRGHDDGEAERRALERVVIDDEVERNAAEFLRARPFSAKFFTHTPGCDSSGWWPARKIGSVEVNIVTAGGFQHFASRECSQLSQRQAADSHVVAVELAAVFGHQRRDRVEVRDGQHRAVRGGHPQACHQRSSGHTHAVVRGIVGNTSRSADASTSR